MIMGGVGNVTKYITFNVEVIGQSFLPHWSHITISSHPWPSARAPRQASVGEIPHLCQSKIVLP